MSKFDTTTQELSERFEGLSQDIVLVTGFWKHVGHTYQDKLIRLRIDSGDTTATTFLRAYKEKLKERFRQLEIWITAHEIEII